MKALLRRKGDFRTPRLDRYRPAVEGLEGRALMSYGGSPDLGYGGLGVTALGQGNVGVPLVFDVAIQADGKAVVASQYSSKVGMAPVPPTFTFGVTRVNTDGSLDATFGNSTASNGGGNGRALYFPTNPSNVNGSSSARSVAIQPDGRIVVAGDVNGLGEVVRLNADGSLDTSFSLGGMQTLLLLTDAERVVLQADGKILIAGTGVNPPGTPGLGTPSSGPAVLRLNSDGTFDTTFGGTGQVSTDFGTRVTSPYVSTALDGVAGVAVQADGKVLVDGTFTAIAAGGGIVSQVVVERLNANGSPDTTYGIGGKTSLPAQLGGSAVVSEVAGSLAIQADGKAVVGGLAIESPSTSTPAASLPVTFLAARVNVDGTVDAAFGNGGAYVGSTILGAGVALGVGEAVQGDGRILLASADALSRPTLVRLNVDGTPDARFGEAGVAILTSGVAASDARFGRPAPAVQADGKILQAAGASIARLIPNGASGDFNNDGITDPAIYLTSYGVFAYRPSGGGPDVLIPFGIPGDGATLPAPGAYNGGGVTELGAYLPRYAAFAYRPYNGSADVVTQFGIPGAGQSIPVPGDYDRSGRDELAVYMPSIGAFAYRPANGGADVVVPFGIPGAGRTIPAPGDYFGTGQADIAAYLPAYGTFVIRDPRTGTDVVTQFGIPGAGQSIPVPGDYDRSGKTELAVYLPALGAFAYRPANGGPDVIQAFGVPGAGLTLPAPGDYDGSGRTSYGAYIPLYGSFAYRTSTPPRLGASPTDVVFPFGIAGVGQTVPFNVESAGAPARLTVAAASVEIPLETAADGPPTLLTAAKRKALKA